MQKRRALQEWRGIYEGYLAAEGKPHSKEGSRIWCWGVLHTWRTASESGPTFPEPRLVETNCRHAVRETF
jgi:hypothetical protein